MSDNTNAIYDFVVWQYGAPVITLTPELEFSVWQYGAPVILIDESYTTATVTRRRVYIF